MLGQQGKLRSPKLIKFKGREKIGGGGGVKADRGGGNVDREEPVAGGSTPINKF